MPLIAMLRSGLVSYSRRLIRVLVDLIGSFEFEVVEFVYRLLSHSGVAPDYTKEPSDLASGKPNVKNVTLLLDQWWGSGIVHAKVWISDRRNVYIGSANNDWKSLTQVH